MLSAEAARNLSAEIEPKWEEHLDLIRRTVAQGATPDELRLFLYIARHAGLDPLAKQIYYIRRKGKGTIQVAIDGLRLIADRTGRYAGGDTAEFLGVTENGFPHIARVTVYKMVGGVRCPFSASARWEEYYPGDDQGFQWRRMPHTMLAKCAEALALRRAFPADLGGLYVHEEMQQAGKVAAVDAIVDQLNGPPAPDIAPDPDPSAPAIVAMGDYSPGPSAPNAEASETPLAQQVGDVANAERPTAAKPIGDPLPPEGRKIREEKPKLEVLDTEALPRAFGYKPPQWPAAKMFGEAATENQLRMLRHKADQRHLNERELDKVREAVLYEYSVDEDASKGAISLVIDFLVAASPAALDAARGVRRSA